MLDYIPKTLESLPGVLYTNINSLPKIAGVYFVTNLDYKTIWYIGQTRNIKTRLGSHHKKSQFDALHKENTLKVVYYSCGGVEDKNNTQGKNSAVLLDLEKYYIHLYNPVLNGSNSSRMLKAKLSTEKQLGISSQNYSIEDSEDATQHLVCVNNVARNCIDYVAITDNNLSFTHCIEDAFTWKTAQEATTYKTQILDSDSNYTTARLVSLTSRELKQRAALDAENYLYSRVNDLEKKASSTLAKKEVELARLLIPAKVGDTVRYYPKTKYNSAFELVKIEKVDRDNIYLNGQEQSYNRLTGIPEKGRDLNWIKHKLFASDFWEMHYVDEIVLPNNSELCKYILSVRQLKGKNWAELPEELIKQIARLL